MKKYEVSEEFIKEAFGAACETWKGKIKKEFPGLFKVKPIVGKWVKGNNSTFMGVILDEEFSSNMNGYGVNFLGNWVDRLDLYGDNWSNFTLATKKEIETMLWKEAEKRGIGKDTKIVRSPTQIGDKCINDGLMIVGYDIDSDELWNKNGCIYKQGKWSTPLNENKEIQEKIDSLQKQLDELKLKVK